MLINRKAKSPGASDFLKALIFYKPLLSHGVEEQVEEWSFCVHASVPQSTTVGIIKWKVILKVIYYCKTLRLTCVTYNTDYKGHFNRPSFPDFLEWVN